MSHVMEFTITADDRVGSLAEITKGLAYEGINIRGLFMADAGGVGRIRFVVDDAIKAERVLSEEGRPFVVSPVLAVEVRNAPGALHSVAKVLAENQINIDHSYTLLPKTAMAIVVIRVTQPDEAADVLEKNGLRVLSESEI
ncbi:MAG: ACT domain-containing protein [Myxococcota bacterium]